MFLLLSEIRRQLLAGEPLSLEQAEKILSCKKNEIIYLVAVANELRETLAGDKVDLCSIVNARAGNCTEDCSFCAQSVHSHANAPSYSILDVNEIVSTAKRAEESGAHRFCIVTAGRGQDDEREFDIVLSALRRIKEETGLWRCCSLGIINWSQINLLKEAGVSRYHHNLETAESFFPEICSTHGYEERVDVIKMVKKAGLEICSGGIIGMGETACQRIELAFALRELDVDSVPVNILNPVPGTTLQGAVPLDPMEIIKSIAIFRLILPRKIIRYGGGREIKLRDLQALGLIAGINGLLLGDYLTTTGRPASTDLAMISDLGLVPAN